MTDELELTLSELDTLAAATYGNLSGVEIVDAAVDANSEHGSNVDEEMNE